MRASRTRAAGAVVSGNTRFGAGAQCGGKGNKGAREEGFGCYLVSPCVRVHGCAQQRGKAINYNGKERGWGNVAEWRGVGKFGVELSAFRKLGPQFQSY